VGTERVPTLLGFGGFFLCPEKFLSFYKYAKQQANFG